MKIYAALLAILLVAGPGWAQEPDSWHGLTLDRATIEDALTVLGQPNNTKENQKLKTPIHSWIDKSARYSRLQFRRKFGVRRATLYFLDDTLKAIVIFLQERINPNSLSQAYGLDFTPRVPKMKLAFSPENYERQAGKIYPKQYPEVYHLIAVSERAYVVAEVNRSAWAMLGAELAGQLADSTSFPGKVRLIQLISPSLRDARGLGALQ
ncbi:MAG: hypothetical protein FVQ81_18160 [Candidatus Glassbacteria bacterium]|nr:hypothetical protein [Candidatus Glassbacteria bacterium]